MAKWITHSKTLDKKQHTIVVAQDAEEALAHIDQADEYSYAKNRLEQGATCVVVNQFSRLLVLVVFKELPTDPSNRLERFRRAGFDVWQVLNNERASQIQITTTAAQIADMLAVAEGLALSTYMFDKYKSTPTPRLEWQLTLVAEGLAKEAVKELNNVVEATFLARDLVNEPVVYLTAEQLAAEAEKVGKKAGFKVKVFDKAKITELNMQGLLTVNLGSIDPPAFIVLEHKPKEATNKHPIVLVGKGVVFDTGGLSLKSTANSMDKMKSDMAGAAAVIGAFQAIAQAELPVYVVGLIPATDNRPGERAITPGDVITMMNGKTVEILNTDAEGRLILADALCYAETEYKPLCVIDLATLTGAAAAAFGREACVMMGTANEALKTQIKQAGQAVFERIVEFPLWEEYNEHIRSDVADIKNIGNAGEAGAIAGGKFLEQFVQSPWVHLDIAGTTFLSSPNHYKGRGATGWGVRLLYHFLKMQISKD